jgi:pilus assembly protein Flp/PilA
MKLLRKLMRLKSDRSGATVIEYCLIAGIITVAIVGGATAVGSSANGSFTRVNTGVWGS